MRIVHRLEDPETLDTDTLFKLYGEALYYLHFNAKLMAEAMWGKPKTKDEE